MHQNVSQRTRKEVLGAVLEEAQQLEVEVLAQVKAPYLLRLWKLVL